MISGQNSVELKFEEGGTEGLKMQNLFLFQPIDGQS